MADNANPGASAPNQPQPAAHGFLSSDWKPSRIVKAGSIAFLVYAFLVTFVAIGAFFDEARQRDLVVEATRQRDAAKADVARLQAEVKSLGELKAIVAGIKPPAIDQEALASAVAGKVTPVVTEQVVGVKGQVEQTCAPKPAVAKPAPRPAPRPMAQVAPAPKPATPPPAPAAKPAPAPVAATPTLPEGSRWWFWHHPQATAEVQASCIFAVAPSGPLPAVCSKVEGVVPAIPGETKLAWGVRASGWKNPRDTGLHRPLGG